MRTLGLTALAALLFAGGFAVVRAQGGGLRDELAALERAAADLRIVRSHGEVEAPPAPPLPFHRIAVITVTSPALLRNPPGYLEAYWAAAGLHTGPGPSEWGPQPFGTIEEVAELLADREEQSGFERPTLLADGLELIFRGPAKVAARIEGYLEMELRPLATRTAVFEVDWEMGAGGGDHGARRSGTRRSPGFRARFLSLVNARSMFWVGRQQAVLADMDVEVPAGPHGATDPAVTRVFSGEWILPELIGAPGALESEITFRSSTLEGAIRRVETRHSGTLDMPRMRETAVRSNIRLLPDQWERIHRGEGVLRVRAHVLPRGSER